jgi:hypothetical protein
MISDSRPLFQSILSYAGKRYFWFAVILTLVSFAIFALPHEVEPRNGGTWQGYTLGIIAALLVVWLLWLGIRKRQYKSAVGTYQGWVSAHVYLGVAVLLIASFHSAFQLGINIHSLSYLFLLAVVFSGIWGMWAYLSLPARTSKIRNGVSRDDCLAKLADLDQSILASAQRCKTDVAQSCESAVVRTVIGGGIRDILLGIDRSKVELQPLNDEHNRKQALVSNTNQKSVLTWLAKRLALSLGGKETESLQELLALFARRRVYIFRIREDVRLHAWLKLWLYIHVPMSLGLLISLIAHILSVFLYW